MIVLFFVTKNDYASLKKSMDVMSTSYEEQIAAIEELHEKELAAREEAIAKFERDISELTEKYNGAIEDLKKSKEEDVQGFIRDFNEQPARLVTEIEDTFGFKYVE